jgi:hypothetical protein
MGRGVTDMGINDIEDITEQFFTAADLPELTFGVLHRLTDSPGWLGFHGDTKVGDFLC